MGSEPNSIRTLREYTRHIPTAEDLKSAFVRSYKEDSPRATAVLLASLVEGALTSLLTTAFPPLSPETHREIFDRDGPLSTFSQKIKMGAALGFYGPQTRHDLDCIREIRNAFAHARISLTFEDVAVANVCARLKYLATLADRSASATDPEDRYPTPPSEPIGLYYVTAYFIGSALDDLTVPERRDILISTAYLHKVLML